MRLWEREIHYYNTNGDFKEEELALQLNLMIEEEMKKKNKRGVVFLCIGTDRSTGDSLGPLIGYKLSRMRIADAAVFGTLDCPVHAMNLEDYVGLLRRYHRNDVIVAVDASVGNQEHIGYITLGKGTLKPGLGVSKNLRAVGDIFITGIVGSCGNYDPIMLQSVRLSIVMRLADCISKSISLCRRELRAASRS